MAIHPGVRAPSQPESPLDRLIREQGLRRFGMFFVTGEGDELPNGEEEKSGYVIDDQGRIYSFWTGWDASRQEVTLTEWELVDEEPEWRGVGEYDRARARAGLPPNFEELLDEAGWLTVPEMIARLETAGYWLRHPTILSRRAKQRHVEDMLRKLRGPHGIPIFIRAQRAKSGEPEYIHPISATPDDIRREGRYLLDESLKYRPKVPRRAQDDHPLMTMDSEGRLVICAEREAEPESADRAQHLLDHLQTPDPETREEDEIQGILSDRLRQRIENGELAFMHAVALQEQQSMRVHIRMADGLRLLAQLLAASEYLGNIGRDEDVLAPAYEAGLFASWPPSS